MYTCVCEWLDIGFCWSSNVTCSNFPASIFNCAYVCIGACSGSVCLYLFMYVRAQELVWASVSLCYYWVTTHMWSYVHVPWCVFGRFFVRSSVYTCLSFCSFALVTHSVRVCLKISFHQNQISLLYFCESYTKRMVVSVDLAKKFNLRRQCAVSKLLYRRRRCKISVLPHVPF